VKFRNDWDVSSKQTKVSEKKILLFSFHDINKMMVFYCVIQLKDHQFYESAGPKSKQSKKFTRKSVSFNIAAFLRFLGLIPVT